ncbi:hypothetical protein GCM10017608_20870 [Agromyces luteolus]|uniref:Uncharacterized protein n=1 Tax=Agromyces luteolus TaxID=88373 RepID=A0A7C9LFD4_9MICO|nr:hypothetical protein [Agromyces luteolus]MUN08791.1 hypothetical protein [Agromyces luteolus]GLK28153.1 hypothetical protein GCM10017608_20870 [Agromyces luteolus]
MPLFSRRARAVAVVASLAAATLLSGCTGTVQDLVERGVEDTVEDATGGRVELSGELPADFPASVPIIDGSIELAGGAASSDGWVVVLTSEAADPLGDARAEVEGAGFREDSTLAQASAAGTVYTDGEFLVILAGEGGTVTYTVTPAP